MARKTVVWGPPGCGKTRNAEAMRSYFGASAVVDVLSAPEIERDRPAAVMGDRERLSHLAEIVSFQLIKADAKAGQFDHTNYSDWRRRHDVAVADMKRALEAEGAVFSERPPHDHAVKLAGIRSTSTSGFQGALRNWLRAARARLEAANG